MFGEGGGGSVLQVEENKWGRTIYDKWPGSPKGTDASKPPRPYADVARLGEVVEADAIGPWFVTPNEAFGNLKPVELIERGEIDRLWDTVYRLQSGVAG